MNWRNDMKFISSTTHNSELFECSKSLQLYISFLSFKKKTLKMVYHLQEAFLNGILFNIILLSTFLAQLPLVCMMRRKGQVIHIYVYPVSSTRLKTPLDAEAEIFIFYAFSILSTISIQSYIWLFYKCEAM